MAKPLAVPQVLFSGLGQYARDLIDDMRDLAREMSLANWIAKAKGGESVERSAGTGR
jgi:hypothetical protein